MQRPTEENERHQQQVPHPPAIALFIGFEDLQGAQGNSQKARAQARVQVAAARGGVIASVFCTSIIDVHDVLSAYVNH